MSQMKWTFVLVALLATAVFGSAGAEAASGAGSIMFQVDADSPVLYTEEGGSVVIRTLVKPGETVRRNVPLAVALVIDKSGSMAADRKMENAKLGAIEALGVLGRNDVATVIAYDSSARVLVGARAATSTSLFEREISRLSAGGNTALYDGVQLAAKQLQPFVKKGYIPRIILLSDGQANVGPASARELAALGRQLAAKEMTVTTIGLGLDYDEDLMTALAAESGGNAYFAKDSETLPDIFARDMDDAVTLSARRIRITLECDGGVRPIRLLGRGGEVSGHRATAEIDNLYGTEKYALFEVDVPARKNAGDFSAGIVRVSYVDPESGKTIEEKIPLTLTMSKNRAEAAERRNTEVIAQSEIAKNAEAREQAIRLADQGQPAAAAKVLKERKTALDSVASTVGAAAAPVMQAEASAFESLADSIETSGGMSNEERKENLNKAYIQKTQQSTASGDSEQD